MANIASAKKRARQAVVRRAQNQGAKSNMRTVIKKVLAATEEGGDKAAAQAAYVEAVSVIDKAANKNQIHANKAARHKSRLNAKVAALA